MKTALYVLKNFYNNFWLVAISVAVALVPSIYERLIKRGGTGDLIGMELRLEDFLILFFFLWAAAKFILSKRKKINKPPLLVPIAIWTGVGLVSLLINWIFFDLGIYIGFFYFLKEIEFFFLYFIIFYLIKNIESLKFILNLWGFFAFIHISWIIFELLTGIRYSYYYGPLIYMEPVGPYPAAGFLLLIFAFLLNYYIFYSFSLESSYFKKIFLSLILVGLILGIIVSGSSTCIFAMFAILPVTFIFYLVKTKSLRTRLIMSGALILSALAILIILTPSYFSDQIKGATWEYSSESESSRIGILKSNLNIFRNSSLIPVILGHGVWGDCHGQYARILLDRGLLGLVAFIILVWAFLRKGFYVFLNSKNAFLTGISAGFLVMVFSMLIISVPADPFMTVKVAEAFWFFTAISLSAFKLCNGGECDNI